jgi:hypothetical protein
VVSHIKIIFDSSMNNMAQGWKWAIQDAAHQWSQAHIRGLFAWGTFGTNIHIDANNKFPDSWAQAFITVRADTTTCQPNEFACSPGPSGISGNFAALPGARVTIHSGNVNGFTQAQRTHTAMHELGHTLGYMHQGVGTQIPFTQQFPPSVMQTGQLSIFELRDDELSAVLLYTEAAPAFNEFAPDTAYCNDPNFPCDLGEGDCDNDSQCKGGLVCGSDNGPLYGLPATYDVCERPARQNNDSVRPVCPTLASTSFCDNPGCPCGIGMGDCDRDSQCGGGLVCGLNNGAAVGLPSDWEVCSHRILPGCAPFDVNVPDSAFCTPSCPCTLGGGDCDSDDDCRGSLVCGSNNGPSFGLPATWDVCVMP